MQRAIPTKFGLISVISTVIVLILILGLAMVSFLVRSEPPTPTEMLLDPVTAITPDIIDPALAVSLLAGVSEADVINQALEKARPGTALATIISSPGLSDRSTVGDLLLLGEKFAAQDNIAHAILSYQLAGTMATLSPDLSDTLRADIFLQVAIGLTRLDEPVLAKVYLDQAVLVALESVHLQAAYRNTVLEAASRIYLDLGLNAESRQVLEQSLSPGSLTSLPEKPLVLPAPVPLVFPVEVQEAEARRWQAAQFLARELVELGGRTQATTLEAVRASLLVEDDVKLRYFAEAVAAEPQLSGKISITRAKIGWQSIKLRVAQQGFGLSLVPEWEAGITQIQGSLAASYEELYRLYNDLIVAIPIASDIDRATEEALRRQILAGQLGQYPNFPAIALKTQLLDATAELIKTQPGTELRVSFLVVGETELYTLISDKQGGP